METEHELTGVNKDKEPIFCRHADLERISDNSVYRSVCPVCKVGALLVRRDPVTFEIIQSDMCVLCGQRVIYTDLGKQEVVEPKKPVRKLQI